MATRTAKSEYVRALDLMARYLALRDHSRHELQTKLSSRFAPDLVDKLLTEAEEKGLLPAPEEIAERAAAAWLRRGKSRAYVEAQLLKRHLPLPARGDEQELQNVKTLVERKFGDPTTLGYEEQGKAYRFLKYRGFADRLIRMVLNGQGQQE